MKLSVQIPQSENPDNREPREIADIRNCFTDHDIAQRRDGGRTEASDLLGFETEHDPLCYKTRHCHIKSMEKNLHGA